MLIILISINVNASPAHIENLKSINTQNDIIKSLRKNVSKSIYIIKSKKNPDLLPELKFYKYRVRKNDNFWKILSKTSSNIDTMLTINSLSSPGDIYPGKVIYISNMRGIVYKTENNESIENISQKYKIDKQYIYKVNRITGGTKRYLFIPCAHLSNIEKSLFMGVGFQFPLKIGRRTSNFGKRTDPFNKKIHFHNGIDIACPIGSKVYAARSGKVFFTGRKGGYGLLIIIKHAHDYYSYYGHLSKIFKKAGKSVKRGEVIGISGNSGRSTGPHLHFETRKKTKPINPRILIK